MIGYYDRQGNPIDMMQWSKLHADQEYKRVAETTLGPYWISTVWLGMDHGFGRGRPVIFETMVFPDPKAEVETKLYEFDMQRYCTLEEAVEGHKEFVLLIRATVQETLEITHERINA